MNNVPDFDVKDLMFSGVDADTSVPEVESVRRFAYGEVTLALMIVPLAVL